MVLSDNSIYKADPAVVIATLNYHRFTTFHWDYVEMFFIVNVKVVVFPLIALYL